MKPEKDNRAKQQQVSNKIITGLTRRDAPAPESHQVRPAFQPLTHQPK